MKEPSGATLDPDYITFNTWIEKVEDVHYKELAEDRNLEFGQTRHRSTTKTNICKRDIQRAPPVHDELLGIMTFLHGGRKYVNGGQHLVEAVRLICEEHTGMKLKPWMYKFHNKLMRVCVCVRDTRNRFKQVHTASFVRNRLIHRPMFANFWLVFIMLRNTVVHSTPYRNDWAFWVVNSNFIRKLVCRRPARTWYSRPDTLLRWDL